MTLHATPYKHHKFLLSVKVFGNLLQLSYIPSNAAVLDIDTLQGAITLDPKNYKSLNVTISQKYEARTNLSGTVLDFSS
jgi:hypothetical protein